MDMREKPDPTFGWPIAVVTGHKYRVHWGEGIDFTSLRVYAPTEKWLETDKSVHFMTNFTDVRASINVTTKYGRGNNAH